MAQEAADFTEEVAAIQQQSAEKGLEEPVIFIGSSTFKMWDGLEDAFPGFPVLNHGFGGSEFTDLMKHQELLLEEFEPSMIVVYAGDNDIANGTEADQVANNAEVFVDGLRRAAHGSLVILLSVKPSAARWEKKEAYEDLNGQLKLIAESLSNAVFVDVWSLLLNRKGEPNQKLFLEDQLHLNEKGYEILRNALLPYLSK